MITIFKRHKIGDACAQSRILRPPTKLTYRNRTRYSIVNSIKTIVIVDIISTVNTINTVKTIINVNIIIIFRNSKKNNT